MEQHKHKCPACGHYYICIDDNCAGIPGQNPPVERKCDACQNDEKCHMEMESFLDDDTKKLIEYLSNLSLVMRQMISDSRSEQLIMDMHKFFEEHCDEDHMLNFAEMVFVFSRALRFVLNEMSKKCDKCDDCDECHHMFNPGTETIH